MSDLQEPHGREGGGWARGAERALVLWTLTAAILTAAFSLGVNWQKIEALERALNEQRAEQKNFPRADLLDYRLRAIDERLSGIESQLKDRRR